MTDSVHSALQVSVVLPTYNEALTLPVVVPRIVAALREAGLAGEIIVVDDNSPDGTAAVARRLAENFPLRLMARTEDRGLAKAVLAGFNASSAEVCVVMDADGSHPPEALPTMVQLVLADKADLVVGSRNLAGGGSQNWSVFSQMKSRLAAFLAFGVTTMTDPTSGFMAIRRNLLQGLPLNPVGWKIVLEIAAKAAPVRIAEVPIVFSDRELGQSKQSLLVFGQYLRHLGQLYAFRFPALAEFLRFCLVGLSGVFLDLGVVIAVKELLNLDTRLCAMFGFAAAVTTNFLFNRHWTFHKAIHVPLLFSYATFVLASLLGLSVRMLVMHGLIEVAGLDRGRGYILINFIGIVCATAVNFLGAKFFAFDLGRLRYATTNEPPPAASADPFSRRLSLSLKTAIGIALLSTLVATLWLARPRSHDEAVNLTMARNIARSSQYLLRPSVVAGGHADWVRDDLPLLGNLPCYPALLSLMDSALGTRGGFLLSWLSLCVTLLATGRLLHSVHPQAGLLCAALLASSPSILDLFGYIEFEPLLVALGMTGLWLFTKGCQNEQAAKAALGGAIAGLSFLVKMWLVVPFVLAATAFVIVQASIVRDDARPPTLHRAVLAGGLTFVGTSSLHLLFVALAAPQDLRYWLQTVYLGLFTGHGVSGTKLTEPGWNEPLGGSAWYYPWLVYRDHVHVLLLTALGLPALLRRTQARVVPVAVTVLSACLGLVFLSIPAAKEPLYLLTVLPFIYGMATLSLMALIRDDSRYRYVDAATARVTTVAALISAVIAAGLLLLGVAPFADYPWQTATHIALSLGVALLSFFWAKNPASLPVSAFFLALAGVCLWLAQMSTTPVGTSEPLRRGGTAAAEAKGGRTDIPVGCGEIVTALRVSTSALPELQSGGRV